MREILFRGKRTDNGEWTEGYLVKIRKESFSDPERYGIRNQAIPLGGSGVCYNLRIDEVIPETVGQYTGFTDKNGTMIWEGDIVQTLNIGYNPPRQYRKPFQVNYNSDFPSAVEEYYSPFEHFTEKVEYEVIGNIHDNPKLLKGGGK